MDNRVNESIWTIEKKWYLNLKYLKHKINCTVSIKNWVNALAKAAPTEPLLGIRNKLRKILMIIPNTAKIFKDLRLPLAVNNVPNI